MYEGESRRRSSLSRGFLGSYHVRAAVLPGQDMAFFGSGDRTCDGGVL